MILSGPGLYRLFLAVAVFISHICRVGWGHAAVYIFFTLSGFWIFSMWDLKYSRTRQPYSTFVISRFWRLAPVFLICSVLAWLTAPYAGISRPLDATEWAREAFSSIFILGYSGLPLQPNTPAWSLDVETQFYILAPAVVALTLSSWRAALFVCLATSIVATAAHLPNFVLTYLIFFAMGGAAYVARWQPSKGVAIGSAAITAIYLAALAASPYRDIFLGGAHPGELFEFNEHLNVAVATTIIPWSIYTTHQPSVGRDPMFGDLSYIAYLVQWPVIRFIDTVSGPVSQRLIHAAVAFLIVAISSMLIWSWVDRPTNFVRSKWVSRRLVRVAAA